MPKIVPIVEGYGEVGAVPLLLRRLLGEMHRWEITVAQAINGHGCGSLKKPGGLERFVNLACREADCAAVLVLLDADDECPKTLATGLAQRVRVAGSKFPVAIVAANREYEAWFLASIESIAGSGKFALPVGIHYDEDVEAPRDVKGWLSAQMPQGNAYQETGHQASMTNLIDIAVARQNSRSFRRMYHAVEEIVAAIDSQIGTITPV
jgi:hypothetical protein